MQREGFETKSVRMEKVLLVRKGLDDSDNPHRWWNTSGDWKKAQTP